MIIWTSLTQCLIKSILKHRLVYLYLNMLDNLKFRTLLLNFFQTISAFIGVNLFKTIPWPKWQTLNSITLILCAYQIMWYPWPNPVLSLLTLVCFKLLCACWIPCSLYVCLLYRLNGVQRSLSTMNEWETTTFIRQVTS